MSNLRRCNSTMAYGSDGHYSAGQSNTLFTYKLTHEVKLFIPDLTPDKY